MNLKKFKLDSYNKIIDDYNNNQDIYMFFLYPLILKLKTKDFKDYKYSIFLKLKNKQPVPFKEYNTIKKYTKKNLDKDIQTIIKCIFSSDYIDKNNIYAIYYLKKHLSTKKQTSVNLINLLYRLLTNVPTKITGGGIFSYLKEKVGKPMANFRKEVKDKGTSKALTDKIKNKSINYSHRVILFIKNLFIKSTFILFDNLFVYNVDNQNYTKIDSSEDIINKICYSRTLMKNQKNKDKLREYINIEYNENDPNNYIKEVLKKIIFYLTTPEKERKYVDMLKLDFKKKTIDFNTEIFDSINSDINEFIAIYDSNYDSKIQSKKIEIDKKFNFKYYIFDYDNIKQLGDKKLVYEESIITLGKLIEDLLNSQDDKDYTSDIIQYIVMFLKKHSYKTYAYVFKNTHNKKLDMISDSGFVKLIALADYGVIYTFVKVQEYALTHLYYNLFLLYEIILILQHILIKKYPNFEEYISNTCNYIQLSYLYYLINFYILRAKKRSGILNLIFLGFPYTSKKYLNGIRKCIFAPISFLLKMLKKFNDKETSNLNIDIHVKNNIEHINNVFNNKIVKYTYLMNDTDYTFKKDLNPSILNNNILLFKSLIFYSSTTELNTSFMYYIFKIFSTYKKYLIFCTLDYIKSDDDDYKYYLNNFLINESINIIKDNNLFTTINNLKNTIIDFYLKNYLYNIDYYLNNPNESKRDYNKPQDKYLKIRSKYKLEDLIKTFIKKNINNKTMYNYKFADIIRNNDKYTPAFKEYYNENKENMKQNIDNYIELYNRIYNLDSKNKQTIIDDVISKNEINDRIMVDNTVYDKNNLYKKFKIDKNITYLDKLYNLICDIFIDYKKNYIKNRIIDNNLDKDIIEFIKYYEIIKNYQTDDSSYNKKFKQITDNTYLYIHEAIKYNINYYNTEQSGNNDIKYELLYLYCNTYILINHNHYYSKDKLVFFYYNFNLKHQFHHLLPFLYYMITHNIKKIKNKEKNIINSIILISLIINIISYKIIINSNINFDNVLNKIKDYFEKNTNIFTYILEIINKNNSADYDFTILESYINIWLKYNDNILIDKEVLDEITINISRLNGNYYIYNLFNIPNKIETVNNNIEINPSVALEDDDDDDDKLMKSLGYRSVPTEIEDILKTEMEATNEEASDEVEEEEEEVEKVIEEEVVEENVEDTSVRTTTVTSKSNYNQEMKRLEEEEEKRKKEEQEKRKFFIHKTSNDIQEKINEHREKNETINVNELLQAEMNKIKSDDSTKLSVKEIAQIFQTVMQQLKTGGTAKIKNDKLKLLIKYILSHLVSSKK